MGFASKLAAANAAAGAAPGGAPAAGGYGAPAPAAGGYGAPAAQQTYGYGSTTQPGAPGAGAGAYGQPAAGGYGQQQQQPAAGAYGQPAAGAYGQTQPGQAYGQTQQAGQYGAPGVPPRPGQPGAPAAVGAAAGAAAGAYGAQQGQYGQQQGQYGQQQGQYGQQQGQYGQQQGQYGAPGQQQGQYGQQAGQYGAPGQQGQYGAQQPGQYGAPQGQYGAQQPGQYGAPGAAPGGAPPAGGLDANSIARVLNQCIQEQKIQAFYRDPNSVMQVAQRVVQTGALQKLSAMWKLPMELAADLAKLSLFDVVVLIDDSGSMAFEQNGERIDDLKSILGKVAAACALFDDDGLQVRFLNNNLQGNNITTEQAVDQLVSQVQFSGLTPLGTSLDAKILQPLLLGPARSNQLRKPLLVIAITDGAPAGEDRGKLAQVITNANNQLRSTPYGPDAVSYQFAQVGNDRGAQQFLSSLDDDPTIGSLIDQTMEYEYEQQQMMQKTGQNLSPEMWLAKLLLGPIDNSYDMKDE